MNLEQQEQMYKMLQALKKFNPDIYNEGALFNQQLLTMCGKIHAGLMQLSPSKRKKFMEEEGEFFSGFAWTYYQNWRKDRAVSIKHVMEVSDMLNVKFKPEDFVGETFYAGIPQVGRDEVTISYEKIDNNGNYCPCDEYGDFIN